MSAVPTTVSRLIVKRGGKSITTYVPKPVVLVDTREQRPLSFDRFPNWIAGSRRATLQTGDYTVEGLETLVCLERKSLADLLGTLTHSRRRFFDECERMTSFKWRALVIEASYTEIKSSYDGEYSAASPNGISGSVDALEVRFGIPVIYASSDRLLVEEKVASWLSKLATYHFLEQSGQGRFLQDDDL